MMTFGLKKEVFSNMGKFDEFTKFGTAFKFIPSLTIFVVGLESGIGINL